MAFGVVAKSRRKHTGPAKGQMVFLDSKPRSVMLEGEEKPKRKKAAKRIDTTKPKGGS